MDIEFRKATVDDINLSILLRIDFLSDGRDLSKENAFMKS